MAIVCGQARSWTGQCSRWRKGFTLIELSIVLVIIGLIAGGVLVGRDLIIAAQTRKIVSEIEQLNTAAVRLTDNPPRIAGSYFREAWLFRH